MLGVFSVRCVCVFNVHCTRRAADGRTLAILRAYANEIQLNNSCYLKTIDLQTLISIISLIQHFLSSSISVSCSRFFALSFHCIPLCLFIFLFLCFSLSFCIRCSISLSFGAQRRFQIEYNKSFHCTNLSSVNDDDLLFDWISEWLVKMFLKYAETWTWWAMQTDIYQQTIVWSCWNVRANETGSNNLVDSFARFHTENIGAPLEHGILESRIFDKKRVFGHRKVMWKHWTMENVTCSSILPPSSTSKIKWNKKEERRKKKKIIKSISMIVNNSSNFLAVFNRIWCYIGTSHWYSHSNFPHSVCIRIRIRIVSCLRFNTLGPLGKFIVCCILPLFPSHRQHTFAAL